MSRGDRSAPSHIGIYVLPLTLSHEAVFLRTHLDLLCHALQAHVVSNESSPENVVLPPNGITRHYRRAGPVIQNEPITYMTAYAQSIVEAYSRRGPVVDYPDTDAPQRVCDSTRPRPVHRSRWPSAYYSTT
jgi:hypothetical protein